MREKNQGNARRQDLALFIECKNRVLVTHMYLNNVQQMVSGEFGRGVSPDTVF